MSLDEQIEFLRAECRFLLSQEMECASRRAKMEKVLNKLEDERAIKRAIGGNITEETIIRISRGFRNERLELNFI